jgi:hypothetical protein
MGALFPTATTADCICPTTSFSAGRLMTDGRRGGLNIGELYNTSIYYIYVLILFFIIFN